MNKNEISTEFNRTYHDLSDTKKEKFSRIVNSLLSVNFLYGDKPGQLDNYNFITENEKVIRYYLMLIDFELYVIPSRRIVYVLNTNENYNFNRLRLSKFESVSLLVLKKMYFVKVKELQDTDQISVTLEDFKNELELTGIFDRINKTDISNTLRLFKSYNIVNVVNTYDNEYPIIEIYPTINYVVTTSNIDDLVKRIDSYKGGDFVEETSED